MSESTAKILIAEDEFSIAMDLEMQLQNSGYQSVGIAVNYAEAIALAADQQPDLILMDINLNDSKTGIEAASRIIQLFDIPIVFISGNTDSLTLKAATSVRSYGFIAKPYKSDDLRPAIEVALARHAEYKEAQKNDALSAHGNAEMPADVQLQHFFVRDKNQLKRINLEEILRLEALDNYTLLYTRDNKFIISSFLKDLLMRMPSDCFIRVHRSHAVHLNAISSMEDNLIYIHGQAVPVSKSYREELLQRLNIL
jgi:DNA-binding LytR/AlgR family response regulator